MSVFENLGRRVTETAKAVSKKSGDLVEVTKLNLNISSEEDKIEKYYAEIGKVVYKSFKSGELVPEDLNEFCEKIKLSEEVIEDMKKKIMDLKNEKICSSCNAELPLDTAFCPKCGTKQEIPQPVSAPEAEAPKTCVCGAAINEGTSFCSKCGAKV